MQCEPETLGERAKITSIKLRNVRCEGIDGMCDDAADLLAALATENVALRAAADAHDTPAWIANERLNMQRDNLIAERDALAAENVRLTIALQKIAASEPWSGRAPLVSIALAALGVTLAGKEEGK